LLLAGLLFGAQEARADDPPGELPALACGSLSVLEAIVDENTPPPGRHYFRSNEWRQDLLVPHLRGRGGVYIGVGSDQNYTMAALAGSELVLIIDMDPQIVHVHKIYGALVNASPDADTLIKRFEKASAPDSERIIHEYLAGESEAKRIVRHFRELRDDWHAYLRRVKNGGYREIEPVSWLNRPELYSHVRRLHRARRVVARNGDLTGEKTVRAMGKAMDDLSLTVRVVYFSNAEQFFKYTPEFIRNMRSLPIDDRSVVVRTDRSKRLKKADPGRWHYVVQDFRDFVERMESGAYPRSFAIIADLTAAGSPFLGDSGISTITTDTPRKMLTRVRRRLESRGNSGRPRPKTSAGDRATANPGKR
jgi:hypothetical protein